MDVKELLEGLFGRRVDLVLSDAVKPRLRQQILQETIYAEGP
jgi:predicted nucleotidyltransferase